MATLVGFSISNGLAPEISPESGKGPRALYYAWQFSVAGPTTLTLDLFEESVMKQMDFVQTIFYNNVANAQTMTLRALGHQQQVVLPPNSYGWLPVFTLIPPQFELIISAAADAVVPMHFVNVPMAPYIVIP